MRTLKSRTSLAALLFSCSAAIGACNFRSDSNTATVTPSAPAAPPASTSPSPSTPELWVYIAYPLNVSGNVTTVQALVDRAALAGYTGILLSDFYMEKMHTLTSGTVPTAAAYTANLQAVVNYAQGKGIKVVPSLYSFGHSGAILNINKNLAEGQKVVGSRFTISGNNLNFAPDFTPVTEGFETQTGNIFTGFQFQDQPGTTTFLETTGCNAGSNCMRIGPNAPGSGRAFRRFTGLTANRQYQITYYMKSQSFAGSGLFGVYDTVTTTQLLNFNDFKLPSSAGVWTRRDFVFNSQSATAVDVKFGTLGSSTGTLWFDDISIQEVALHNLVKRTGTPVTIYGTNGFAGTFTDGTDTVAISDAGGGIGGTFTDYHTPPTVTLPSSGGLFGHDTSQVRMDYTAVAPVLTNQVGATLCDPAIISYMNANIASVKAALPTVQDFLINYDEFRQINTSPDCVSQNLTAGQLLANHLTTSVGAIKAAVPSANIFLWNDMFDPYFNAVTSYYLVGGTLANSWANLDPNFVVFNWIATTNTYGATHKLNSFKNFQSLGMKQIIAGYYDLPTGGTQQAINDIQTAVGATGVIGIMYTTWANDFTNLESYAASAKANWSLLGY